MSDEIKTRQIIITFKDFCEEPFEEPDKNWFSQELTKILEPYDVEVIKIEIKDVVQ